MSRKIFGMLLAAGLLLSAGACNNKADDEKQVAEEANDERLDNSEIEKDAEFAVEVADAGMFEIEVSKLAVVKAKSPRVKQFAQKLVDDHTKLNDELKAAASEKNIVLPDVMSEKCQKEYYDLDQKYTDAEFDREYVDLMVEKHKDAIDKFEKESDRGDHAELRSWANEKLATLRNHLSEAERLQESFKK